MIIKPLVINICTAKLQKMSRGLLTVPIFKKEGLKNNLGLINGIGKRKEKSNAPVLNLAEPWEIFYNAGVEYFRENKLIKALDNFSSAIVLKEDFPEAWNNRGICLLRIGDFQEAFNSINEALKLRPNYKLAMENKLIVLRELKDRKTAIYIDRGDLVLTSNRSRNKLNRDLQLPSQKATSLH